MKNTRVSSSAALVFAMLLCLFSASPSHAQTLGLPAAEWTASGQNVENSRSQPQEFLVNSSNAKNLSQKWVFSASGDVYATPTVAGNEVYFPDSAGNLFAVRKDDGALLWSHAISDYLGGTGARSRTSPAADNTQIYIGDFPGTNQVQTGTHVIAVDRETGTLRWVTQVDSHPAAFVSGSPVVFDGLVYVGVSSSEEGLAESSRYECCTFRGSIVALEAKTGKIVWRTYDMPENGGQPGGYSGGAIWSSPAIDPARRLLYIGTGNNYTVPAEVAACQRANAKAVCTSPDDHFDSVLAMDLKTGKIRWARRLQGSDTWTLVCIRPMLPQTNCQVPTSPDFDFGSGPNVVGNLVGIGQKSGIYWALDANNGRVVWSTQVGPSGSVGGILWGTATDGKRIYAAVANDLKHPYTLQPSGRTITWGAWTALDVRTGKILWQTADPIAGSVDAGAVSVANGVLYAGSYSGQMYAMNSATGKILWNFASGGSVADGPAIVDGSVYWGSGYRKYKTGNNKLFRFSLPRFGDLLCPEQERCLVKPETETASDKAGTER